MEVCVPNKSDEEEAHHIADLVLEQWAAGKPDQVKGPADTTAVDYFLSIATWNEREARQSHRRAEVYRRAAEIVRDKGEA